MTDAPLPRLGNLGGTEGFKVTDAVTGLNFISQGRHIIVGQRRNRGSTSALVLLGKCVEHGGLQNLFDANVWLDVEHPHVIFIAGKRGSGKSYDLGVLVEGLALTAGSGVTTKQSPVATVIFDTQNQFWTLLSAPDEADSDDKAQIASLRQWRLAPAALSSVQLFRPAGAPTIGVLDQEFAVAPSELTLDDWAGLFGLDRFSPMPQLLRSAIELVSAVGWTTSSGMAVAPASAFGIEDIIACLQDSAELSNANDSTRQAILWRLEAYRDSQIFDPKAAPLESLLSGASTTVFLLRDVDDATKAVVVSVFCRRLFRLMGSHHTAMRVARRLKRKPPESSLPNALWVVIDEAHVVAPAVGMTAAKPTLSEFVKRGRDAGLSLVIATQQPSALDSAILSQADVNLTHRLVIEPDIASAVDRFPSRLPRNVKAGTSDLSSPSDLIRALPDGQALLGDSESPRGIILAVRPRLSPHGGGEPSLLDDARPA